MIGRALVVPRARAEEVRRALLERAALRTDVAILRGEGTVTFPLRPDVPIPSDWGEVVERTFSPHRPRGPGEFRELLPWGPELLADLPRSFDVIGEIVLVRIPPSLETRKEEIGEALLRFVPGARIVGWDRGVHGPERRRSVERIAGAGGWRTRHRENRLEIEVDVERAYFSPRLAREHALVAGAVAAGERVYDLACGVGPFSLTIAQGARAREIVAVDANEEAIALLRSSAARYPFASRIRAERARIEAFVESAEPFERAVFNLPREGIKYAPLVARAVAPGGRLHYYEVVPRAGASGRAELIASALPPRSAWRPVESHSVHPYSPSADLVAFLFERGPA